MKKISFKFIVIGVLFLFMLSSFLTSETKKYSDKAKDYFLDVALGTQYGSEKTAVTKWVYYIKVYIDGDFKVYMKRELDEIVEELNQLTNNIKLNIVPSKDSSNLLIFLGSGEEYAKKFSEDNFYAPSKRWAEQNNIKSDNGYEKVKKAHEEMIREKVKNNYGFVWTYWNGNFEIEMGSIFIDMKNIKKRTRAMSLLRENLAKSLGFMHTSKKYKNSVFYDGWKELYENWNDDIDYNNIDKDVIEILYSDKIKPGMSEEEVRKILDTM